MEPGSSETSRAVEAQNKIFNRKIRQLNKQLELAQKMVKRLRRDKKQLGKKLDLSRGECAKMATQLNWKNLEFKRKQKELEASHKDALWQLKHKLYKKNKTMQEELESMNLSSTLEMYEDPEINEIFNTVYALEANITKSLSIFDSKNNQFSKAKDFLDGSFETISLLIQESKIQKGIIHELNLKLRELAQKASNQIWQLNQEIIEKTHKIQDLQQDMYEIQNIRNAQRSANLNSTTKGQFVAPIIVINEAPNIDYVSIQKELQQTNLKYLDTIHEYEFAVEKLKSQTLIQQRQIDTNQSQITSLELIQTALSQQIALMNIKNNMLQDEKEDLMKNLQFEQTTSGSVPHSPNKGHRRLQSKRVSTVYE